MMGHDYLITVDVARGVEKDYSAFVLVDITTFPHRIVGKYRNNQIKPCLLYTSPSPRDRQKSRMPSSA